MNLKRRFKHTELENIKDMRELLERSDRLYSDKIAYKEILADGTIAEYPYSQISKDVNALGTKLLEMGLKDKHIAILGENSYAWVVSYLAIINGVGVAIPLDKELMEDDIAKLLLKCDADAIICSKTFAPNVAEIVKSNSRIKASILMYSDEFLPNFHSLEMLIKEGEALLALGNRDYLDRVLDVDKMCEIVFTSGTTGDYKGTMLSQKNLATVVMGAMSLIEAEGISFSVLPINHTYECSCHILGGIYSGITICFNDSLKRVIENINKFKPNMSIMVPLVLESIYKNIWRESEKQGLADHLRYGIYFSNLLRKVGIDKRRYFFKPVLEKFGGNLEQIVCGGAPLREEVAKGLSDLGIDVINGFGITECAPLVSSNMRRRNKFGSVGRVMYTCEVRIDNPDKDGKGEIQVKGDNVMLGYYKDPEGTRASFTEDGWYKTGDLGYLDRDNYLYITGREKNLIILSNGKNVSPEEIEDLIISKMPYVKEIVVYVKSELRSEGQISACAYLDEESVAKDGLKACIEKLNRDIKDLNRSLPTYKCISNILVSESEFIKTSTKKIKRNLVKEGNYINA